MADPAAVIGVAGTVVSLVADAMRLHHEVRVKVDSLRDAPDEIRRLRRLLPTYEHTVASLQHFVRSSESGLAADHDLAERVERCVCRATTCPRATQPSHWLARPSFFHSPPGEYLRTLHRSPRRCASLFFATLAWNILPTN